ncbi:MAG: diguanylate cyclase, partial [Sinobacteraceae bacterium]|nr:diguanylate cyclase [Nevskiaceae bacterium]
AGSTTSYYSGLALSEMPRVLLVDDDELILEHLRGLIVAAGFEVNTVIDAGSALASLGSQFAPIVILDRQMPGMDGLSLCRAIRQQSWPGYVYILLLTAQDSEEDILAGLDAGADDYLGKRTSPAQLLARLRTARRILALEHSLRNALEEKRRLSLTDSLTGLGNRRYFLKHLGRELKRLARSGGSLSLLSLDIDHFKQINDTHGHAAGDAVLEEFARRVNSILRRETDWCARVGGEEFAVVLGDTAPVGAAEVAEAIRASIASQPISAGAANISVTVSIGISGCEPAEGTQLPTVELLLQHSDQALYASKARGRNCVTQARR